MIRVHKGTDLKGIVTHLTINVDSVDSVELLTKIITDGSIGSKHPDVVPMLKELHTINSDRLIDRTQLNLQIPANIPVISTSPQREYNCISCGFLNAVSPSKLTFICRNCGLEQQK